MTREEIDAKLDEAISGIIGELNGPDDLALLTECLFDMTRGMRAEIIRLAKEAGLAAVGSIDIPTES